MDYESAVKIVGSNGQRVTVPVGSNWPRVTFALAGYGYVVPGTLSDPVPVAATSTASETCQAVSSISRTCNATSSIEVV